MEKNNVFNLKKTSNELSRYIEFSLGKEDYAIPLLYVREVISMPETTPIPKSPTHFLGIMNLRGQVISVIDLRKKLKIENSKKSEEAVIIVEINGLNIGVVVDSINKVLTFSNEEVSEVPDIDSQLNTKYILGIYKKENSLTVLLDMALVLDIKEIESFNKEAA